MRSQAHPSSGPPRDQYSSGYTLLELMLVVFLLTLVMLTVGKNFLDFSRAFSSMTRLIHARTRAQTIMDRMVEELVTGKFTSMAPALPFESSTIEFQKIVGFSADSPVFGNPIHIELIPEESDTSDGLDNDGDGLVDEGGIRVWEDLPPHGATPVSPDAPVTISTRIQKDGLKFTRQGSILLIDMTVQEVIDPGQPPRSIRLRSGVKMRNT